LGVTICIRQVGAFVGLLVTLAALRRGRNRALFPLIVYWLLAAVVTLVTWPYLWADPIHRIFESLQLAATFSRHSTIFQGVRVASGELPWDYFPTLTALQLTETAVALVVAGLLIAIVLWVRGDRRRFLIGVLFLWFGVPLALLITLHTAGYEFRHFLFMLPPLLILGGLALQAIGERLRAGWLRALLFVVAILPGVIGIVRLHPYEYIYFNSLAGGVSGADGRFQLERECLSYREGIEAVNRIAAPGAVVIVPQQTNQVEPFARPDLVLRDATQGYADADFVLSCTWRDAGDWRTGGFERVFEVRRGTAVFMQVWERMKAP